MDPHSTSPQTPPSPGPWALPASILLGSIIVTLFVPLFALGAVAALVWLVAVHRSTAHRLRDAVDQTEFVRDEMDSVRALVELLGSVIDAAETPILSTDRDGIVVQANLASKVILGSGRSLIGEHFDGLITQGELQELERLARRGESGHARLDLPSGGSMRVFDVAMDPIPATGGTVCTFTDITELTHSVELKADFAANASHELRTPIASIKGAIETLQGPARRDEPMVDKLLGIIAGNADRLDHMVQDLLDLSKLESGGAPASVTRIDLRALVNGVCSHFGSVCERRELEINTRIDEDLRVVASDPTLLELVVRNLIENATKFARDGTAIRVTIQRAGVAVDPQSPPPEGLDHGEGVSIRVKDKGVGIPLAHQSRIFERFYQVDESRSGSSAKRGTGLGLAIVKHAARTLGGSVGVESVHGQGTTMTVDLPGCVPEDQASDAFDPDHADDADHDQHDEQADAASTEHADTAGEGPDPGKRGAPTPAPGADAP